MDATANENAAFILAWQFGQSEPNLQSININKEHMASWGIQNHVTIISQWGGQLACKQQWLTSEVNCGKLLLEEVYEKLYEVVHVPFRTLL
jgi:hypothetical protein